jgi:hypothetical protein
MSSRWFPRLFPAPPAARRRRRTLWKGYQPAYVEILENRIVLSAQNVLAQTLATLPGTSFDDVAARFDLTQGRTSFAEVGIFTFEANGTVAGLTPDNPGFEDAVLNSSTRQVLFGPMAPGGNSINLTLIGGSQIGVYVRQNEGTGPMEDRFRVQMTGANTLRIGIDETPPLWSAVSRGPGSEARRFDDASINVTLGNAIRFPSPILNPLPNHTIPEQQPFQSVITGQNPAGPATDLRYQLDQAPAGMAIDPMSGLLTWTPAEAQGPGRFDVIVRVFNVNRPLSFATQRFTVDVTEVNSAPVISPVPDQTVFPGQRVNFVVNATDSDLPAGPNSQLTFSLVNSPAPNATIDPVTGRFDWIPAASDVGQMFEFTVRVVDSGNPALDDTETFTIQVNPFF